MSEAELRNPTAPSRNPASTPIEVSDDSDPPDPLLGSGSFIDPDRSDSGAESSERLDRTRNGEFDPLTVIAATPISIVAPDDDIPETVQKVRARRDPEEMAKRPSWLPENWKIDLRVRTSGATAGLIDRLLDLNRGKALKVQELGKNLIGPTGCLRVGKLKSEEEIPVSLQEITINCKIFIEPDSSVSYQSQYYIEPSGQRKFRSKNEVLHFLETGSKLKRKSPSEGDAEPSGNSATPKQKKSGAKSSKSGAGNEI